MSLTHTHQSSRWNWRLAAAMALNAVLWVSLVGLADLVAAFVGGFVRAVFG